MFAFSFTIFFENFSKSHPLAKIEVMAFSPKEVKSSDFDQSGTIQMMKDKQPQKILFFIISNDVQIGHKQRQDTHIKLRRPVRGRTCNFSQSTVFCPQASEFRLESPGYLEVLTLSE